MASGSRSGRDPRPRKVCAEPGCAASVPDHYWGHVKAEDWFFQRDGSAWCPQHIPAWVAGWRAQRSGGGGDGGEDG